MAHRNLFASKSLDVPKRLVTKKAQSLKALRVNRSVIRTYLLCAPSQHHLLSSESSVVAIELVAVITFWPHKRPTSLRLYDSQNRSASRWWPISQFTGRAHSQAANTSITCPECGHVSKDNRVKVATDDGFEMEEFKCAECGHEAHADENLR